MEQRATSASPFRRALELAWESAQAGSLGVGATIVGPDATLITTGRNRLLETDVGGDVLANTSLAHAELNALAKLPYRAYPDELELYTTLQPCVQCLAAVLLSPVVAIRFLAPDPLFRDLERIWELNDYLADKRPSIAAAPATKATVLALVLPLRHIRQRPQLLEPWRASLPDSVALADGIASRLDRLLTGGAELDDALTELADELESCVAEVDGYLAGQQNTLSSSDDSAG